MKYEISNGRLTVSADTLGAQLCGIQKAGGTEYLWQGKSDIWQDRAPVLFPYVARLTGGQYRYKGKSYFLPIHGFASSMEFACEMPQDGEMRFVLRDTPETLRAYPFPFCLTVSYRLEENRLYQEYTVKNTGAEIMYFGLGAHPGFNVPMEEGLSFEDYVLEFDPSAAPVRIGFTEQCFLNGKDVPFPLEGGKLPLAHDLFDHDAVVLRDTGGRTSLYSPRGKRSVTVEYFGIPYLGIWHCPRTDAAYVCIEPWCSLPSRQDVVEELEKQPDLIRLPAGETYCVQIIFIFK